MVFLDIVLLVLSFAQLWHGNLSRRLSGVVVSSSPSSSWHQHALASACRRLRQQYHATHRTYIAVGIQLEHYHSPFCNNVLDQKSLSALTRWRLVVLSLPYPLCALCVGILSILIYFQIGLCDITIGLCEQIICQSNAESASSFQMCYEIRF